jgi:hypothetical protein
LQTQETQPTSTPSQVRIDPVTRAIQVEIESYLKDNPNLSLRSIANNTPGVSREYVRKLASGELTSDKLNREKVLSVLKTLSNKDTISDILKHYSNPIATYLNDAFKGQYNDKMSVSGAQIESVMADDKQSVAYILSTLNNGVSEAQATQIQGKSGALGSLWSQDLLDQIDGRYRAKSGNMLVVSMKAVKSAISNLLRLYKPDNYGTGTNYAHFQAEALNEKGMRKKQDLHRKFHTELMELYKDTENHGDIPTFSAHFSDAFEANVEVNHD